MDQQDIDEAFWQQIQEDYKLAILCNPADYDALVEEFTEVGYLSRFDIIPSEFVEVGYQHVVDVHAAEASTNEMLHHDWTMGGIWSDLEDPDLYG